MIQFKIMSSGVDVPWNSANITHNDVTKNYLIHENSGDKVRFECKYLIIKGFDDKIIHFFPVENRTIGIVARIYYLCISDEYYITFYIQNSIYDYHPLITNTDYDKVASIKNSFFSHYIVNGEIVFECYNYFKPINGLYGFNIELTNSNQIENNRLNKLNILSKLINEDHLKNVAII